MWVLLSFGDALPVHGGLHPHVLEIPPVATILERAHPDHGAVAIGDPHVVHLEVAGQDRQLGVPVAHPGGRVIPVRLRAMREIGQRVGVVGGGAPDDRIGSIQRS